MSKEKKLLDDIVGSFNKLTSGINDAAELFELSMAEEDWDTCLLYTSPSPRD